MLAARRIEFAFLRFAIKRAKIRARPEINKSRRNGDDRALGISENVEERAQGGGRSIQIGGAHIGPFARLQASQQGLHGRDGFCRSKSAMSGPSHKSAA